MKCFLTLVRLNARQRPLLANRPDLVARQTVRFDFQVVLAMTETA